MNIRRRFRAFVRKVARVAGLEAVERVLEGKPVSLRRKKKRRKANRPKGRGRHRRSYLPASKDVRLAKCQGGCRHPELHGQKERRAS